MLAALDDADLDIPLIIGGIILEADIFVLEDAGVAAILGPGALADEVVAQCAQSLHEPDVVSVKRLSVPELVGRALGVPRRAIGECLLIERGGEPPTRSPTSPTRPPTAPTSSASPAHPAPRRPSPANFRHLPTLGLKPAVLAVDPSPLTGGAILGDRSAWTMSPETAASSARSPPAACRRPGTVGPRFSASLDACGFDLC